MTFPVRLTIVGGRIEARSGVFKWQNRTAGASTADVKRLPEFEAETAKCLDSHPAGAPSSTVDSGSHSHPVCDGLLTAEDFMSRVYVLRRGKMVEADEVHFATGSGDLGRMLRALDLPTNPIERHFLLLTVVEKTHRLRDDPNMTRLCMRIAELHLAEFSSLAPVLRAESHGNMPFVPTFQKYATLLAELGDFDRAVWVCEQAKLYGIPDDTKSGFDGRISRIQKKQKRLGS